MQLNLDSVQCTVYSAVYSALLKGTQYSVHCQYSVLRERPGKVSGRVISYDISARTTCSGQCAVLSVQWAVCSAQCAMCSAQCAMCHVQCTVRNVPCAVYIVQCAVRSIDCVQCLVCSVGGVQYAVFNV